MSTVVKLARTLLVTLLAASTLVALPVRPVAAQSAAPAPSPGPVPDPVPVPRPPRPTVPPTPPTTLPKPPDPQRVLASLPYRILTQVPGQPERSQAATQGVPAAVDVNGDRVPDLVVELAGPLLRVARSGQGTAPLRVRVVVVVSVPQLANRSVAFGYDALGASAPTLFSTTIGVLADDSYSLDVATTGPGGSLALVATLFEGGIDTPRSQWASRNPLDGRLGYAPVPESARFEVQKLTSESSRITVGAARPTVADVVVEKTAGELKRRVTAHVDDLPAQLSILAQTDGSGLRKLEYTASQTIDSVSGTVDELSPPTATVPRRHADVAIEKLPASLTIDVESGGSGLKRLVYGASSSVPTVRASFEERSPGVSLPAREARVELAGLPTRLEVARPSEDQVAVTASPSVGTVHAGFARNTTVGALTVDPQFPATFSNTQVDENTDRTLVRLLGVSRAVLSAGDPFTLELTQSSQKFKAHVRRASVNADVEIDKLPAFVKLTYSPATKRVGYSASSTIDRIFVRAVHPTGFVKDARTLTATLRGVPRTFVLNPAGVVPAGSGATPFAQPAPAPAAPAPAVGPPGRDDAGSGVVAPANPPVNSLIDDNPNSRDDQGGSCPPPPPATAAAFSFDAGVEVLGSVELTLTNGRGTPLVVERTFPAAGHDGVLVVQGPERVHVVGKLTQLRRVAFDRFKRPGDVCRGEQEQTTVNVDSTSTRPFGAHIASSDQDMTTMGLTPLVPKVSATIRRVPGNKVLNRLFPFGDRTEIDYSAQPGSHTRLSFDVVQAGLSLMSLDVPRLPSSVHLCTMKGSDCAPDLDKTEGDRFGSNLELGFTASEPMEAHFSTCFDADGCRILPIVNLPARSLTVDIPSVQRFDLAVKAPKFDPLNNIREDGYLFVDTDNRSLSASAVYRDSADSRVQSVRANLPSGFKAENRKVGLRVLGGSGACCDGVGVSSRAGTITCPAGTSFFVRLNNLPDQQMANELC